jgi:hypothetical protein
VPRTVHWHAGHRKLTLHSRDIDSLLMDQGLEENFGAKSPIANRLLSCSESDASAAVTPERRPASDGDVAFVSQRCAPVHFTGSSTAKTVTRPSLSRNYNSCRTLVGHHTDLLQLRQRCDSVHVTPPSPEECQCQLEVQPGLRTGLRGGASEQVEYYIEECVDYMLRCESLEKKLHDVDAQNKQLQLRLSETTALHESLFQQAKADHEADTKRFTSVVEVLKADALHWQSTAQEMARNCSAKEALLRTAQQECTELQNKLADVTMEGEFKASSQAKVALEAAAAAEQRATVAVQAAEARVVQGKVSAAAEIQRCRSEAERLVTELGEAKATINDYMWRCEAMQSSLNSAQQNVTCCSEAAAAAHRRATADLEAANISAQAARAAWEAEAREWREEVARLQDEVAESSATVEKFIEHSCTLQRRLDASEAESLGLQKLLARISR